MTVAVMILVIGVELLKSSVGKILLPRTGDVQLGERRRGWPRRYW